jgi:hypothetical protein
LQFWGTISKLAVFMPSWLAADDIWNLPAIQMPNRDKSKKL